MRKQVIGLLAIYCALLAAACTDKASDNIAPQWLSSEKPVYNAMCQTDTLRFRAAGNWQVTTDCDWMTLMQEEGQGDGAVSVYIQQNDDEQARQGELVVHLEDGQTLNLHVTQYSSDDNALGALVNLPQSYGLGWGYDFSVDYADPDGLLAYMDREEAAALAHTLEQDPRPHYHDDPLRIYGMPFGPWEVRFRVCGGQLTIVSLTRIRE